LFPRISIITPSYNQGRFIEETVKSVLAQDYPDVEHIIIDGGSTDGTLEILGKYSHLKTISGPDKGQAEAVNKGLKMASGEIIGWLNSDDTYFPGTLKEVAAAIDPGKGIYMAMGRCAYIDEEGHFTGKEHPSAFSGHGNVVKVWKGHTIPQPALFFHRKVYEECGGLDESLYFVLDYELFLRYTERFGIRPVDRLWATYRLHSASKTLEIFQGELLERSVEISKRYWGKPASLSYWNYFLSYMLYGGRVGIISIKKLNRAEKAFREKRPLIFLGNLFLSFLLFPPTILRYLVLPRLRSFIPKQGPCGITNS